MSSSLSSTTAAATAATAATATATTAKRAPPPRTRSAGIGIAPRRHKRICVEQQQQQQQQYEKEEEEQDNYPTTSASGGGGGGGDQIPQQPQRRRELSVHATTATNTNNNNTISNNKNTNNNNTKMNKSDDMTMMMMAMAMETLRETEEKNDDDDMLDNDDNNNNNPNNNNNNPNNNNNNNEKAAAVIKVPPSLIDAINAVRRLVPRTRLARKALEELDEQIANLHVALKLEPQLVLYAPVEGILPKVGSEPLDDEEFDEDDDDNNNDNDQHNMVTEYDKAASILPVGVGMTVATYPANAPSEDRYTVVLGHDFVFAGVWDGHGGTLASEYASKHVFQHFTHAVLAGASSIAQAFTTAFAQTDQGYLEYARLQTKDPSALFAGTCAVACFVNFNTRVVTCANLGDSRAVMAVVHQDQVKVIALSDDHTTENPAEQERLRKEHPHDDKLIVNVEEDEDEAADWRLKGIAAFTRSLGDMHLKDKASAAVFNSYMPPHRRIVPRPGIKAHRDAPRKTAPYLTHVPEIKQANFSEGFIIIACDGVWDEMSSEEAVHICYDIIRQKPDCNVADAFIEKTLEKAVARIIESDPGEAGLTLPKLKARPQGKAHWSHRSNLHDDITVVILQFNGMEPLKTYTATTTGSSSSNHNNNNNHHHRRAPIFEFERRAPERHVSRNWSNLSTFSRESLLSDSSDNEGEGGPQYISHGRPALNFHNSTDFSRDMLDMFMATGEDLTKETCGELLARLGRPMLPAKLDETFALLDVNGTGHVSMRVFEKWWSKKSRRQSTTKLRKKAVYNDMAARAIERQRKDSSRQSTNGQILQMIEIFGGMTMRHLRILYDVLDAKGVGLLSADEIQVLLRKVLREEPTNLLVDTTFAEMDEDRSGSVDFSEFCTFFGIDD